MNSLGYRDTDKKIEIEIYGLQFELPRLTNKMINELQEKTKNAKDITVINETIDLLLGQGSVEKMNNRRKEDGYEELDVMGALQVASWLQQMIAKEMVKLQGEHRNTMNREYRPYNNRNEKRYNNRRY